MGQNRSELYDSYINYKYKDNKDLAKENYVDDKENIKRFLKNIKKNKPLFKNLEKFDKSNLALLICLYENSNENPIMDRWFSNFFKYYLNKDIDFRILNENYFTSYEDILENLSIFSMESSQIEMPLKLKINWSYVFKYYLYEKTDKNPLHFKYKVNYSDEIIYQFDETDNILLYPQLIKNYLKESLEINDKDNRFSPLDIFLIILHFSYISFLRFIDMIFDRNLKLFSDLRTFNELMEKLISLATDYLKILKNVSEVTKVNMDNMNFIIYLSFLQFVHNRNDYMNDICSSLATDSNYNGKCDESYYINPIIAKSEMVNTIGATKLACYCKENEVKSTDAFNKNNKFIKKFNQLNDLNLMKRYKGNPTVGILLDINNLLDFKILYYAIYPSNKKEKTNLINTILHENLKYNTYSQQEDFDLSKYDEKKYDIMNNEKNNILFKNTILITETIRKAYFREFSMMEQYRKITEYKNILSQCFNSLIETFNPHLQYFLFNELFENTKLEIEDYLKNKAQ